MRRGLVVGVQTVLLLLAGASPALSHATFPGQGPLAAQADQVLNMAVPEERDPDTHNVGVTVALPASWTAVRCQATAPWQCTITPGQIQWTKVPPTAPPGPNDVAFVFTVHTGGPGTYPIPVIQTYSPPTNEVVRWIGPPDSAEPAPVLTVSAPATSPTPPASAAPPAPASPAPPAPASPPKPPPASAPPAAAPAPASPHPTASTAHPAATAATPPAAAAPASSPSPSPTPTATETANSSPSATSTVISAPDDHSGKKVSQSGSGALLAIGAVAVVALLGAGWAA
ncbi:MAG TPA: hypothetical protein VGK51_11870, partial [Actinomycetota bacterium]